MRALLLVLAATACAAQADPCAETGPDETGIAVEGGAAPDCFELPPRPPSSAVLVPFLEGSRWEFSVETQSYHLQKDGMRYDTLGTESWRVEGTTEQGGRSVPVLHVVRTDPAGVVTDRARCAVVVEVEPLPEGHWARWERAVLADLTWRQTQTERRARSPRGTFVPPEPDGAQTAGMRTVRGPQETVRLRFETLEGECPRVGDGARVAADPMAEVLGDLLIGADLYPSRVRGISRVEPAEAPGQETALWLFAGGVGPYLRAAHVESSQGEVRDVYHRLTAARVGDVALGRFLHPDLDAARPPADPAPEPEAIPQFVRVGPNPFRETLTVRVAIPTAGAVSAEVYDVMGRRISETPLGERPAGEVEFSVDGGALAAGVYVIRVAVGPRAAVRRVTRVR